MIDISRVAFVACGCLREFSKCWSSWNIFDEQHNYVLTWDMDYRKTLINSNNFYPIKIKENELIDNKKEGNIVDYQIFIEQKFDSYILKSPFLWSQIENYISYDYDYVLITRPDLVFFKKPLDFIKSNYKLPKKDEVQTMNINHTVNSISDNIFFMRRYTYTKFSDIYNYISTNISKKRNIHEQIYDFFSSNDLNVTDTFKFYTHSNFYRTTNNISKDRFNVVQLNEEFFRSMEPKGSTGNLIEDNIIIILIESKTILDGEYKRLVFNKALKIFESEIKSIKNPSIRVFETSDIENIGMEKLLYYCKIKNVSFSKILPIKATEIFKMS